MQKTVNNILRAGIVDWLAQTGKRSGLQNYYLRRLRTGVLLEEFEKHIVEYLCAKTNVKQHALEIGSGIGQLPIALALSGIRCTGIDTDKRRIQCANFLKDSLAEYDDSARQNLDFIRGKYPASPDRSSLGPQEGRVLLLTNCVSSIFSKVESQIWETFRDFNEVIVTVSLYGQITRDRERQDQLISKAEEMGMIHTHTLFDRIVELDDIHPLEYPIRTIVLNWA